MPWFLKIFDTKSDGMVTVHFFYFSERRYSRVARWTKKTDLFAKVGNPILACGKRHGK